MLRTPCTEEHVWLSMLSHHRAKLSASRGVGLVWLVGQIKQGCWVHRVGVRSTHVCTLLVSTLDTCRYGMVHTVREGMRIGDYKNSAVAVD